ncbi:DUF1707 domain-containing protein [Pseudonocardia sp. N23]|uniref:DUF1707 SHOCT-like domain-containing protein n=1 Tax=Pseudonocardia sp. N23 TaxID=1987376 RepID=UPI0015599961|nr:DUF1707 domain-containing protein [Pseudonocardia sp. N23]
MNEPVPADRIRVSDAERKAVQDLLLRAQGRGLLDISEYDERVQAVWAGKTRGDLAIVTADLPDVPDAPEPATARRSQARRSPTEPRAIFSDTGGGTAMRVLAIVFGSVLAVNVVVWGIVSATNVELIYPWFVWTVIPLVVLGVLYVAGIGRPRGDR